MNLYVRADADSTIGTGHIMRCIALAQAWQDQGSEVTFISHCESAALRERIQIEGFRFIPFDKVYPDASDLKTTLSIQNNEKADQKPWLVLDGYHFTPEYQNAIRDEGILLLVIDDMNHLPLYYADILLNQNIHAPDLSYHCDEDTTLLLGPSYVLLRREFLKYWDFKREIPDRAKNILVTFGGADPDNVTIKVIEALKLLAEPDIAVKIIIGPANPHQEMLRKALAPAHFEAELLINPPNMPELLAWADMAVSAAGSTCWELAFMGLPNVLVVLAENQRRIAEGLIDAGVAVNLGWCNKVTDDNITEAVGRIIKDFEIRREMSLLGQELVDGYGAIKACEIMKEETL